MDADRLSGRVERIAVDPGSSGGIAWLTVDGRVGCMDMPETPADILDRLKTFGPCRCVIERVGDYVAGNSGPAAVKFARHCGHLDLALLAACISVDLNPTPSKWEHWLIGRPNYYKIPKDTPREVRAKILEKRKRERKNKIKAKVQARFPDLKITLKTSDALGMLLWAMAQ